MLSEHRLCCREQALTGGEVCECLGVSEARETFDQAHVARHCVMKKKKKQIGMNHIQEGIGREPAGQVGGQ
jgi:hypothetical protein